MIFVLAGTASGAPARSAFLRRVIRRLGDGHPALASPHDKGAALPHPGLAIDAGNMVAHGVARHPQLLGDRSLAQVGAGMKSSAELTTDAEHPPGPAQTRARLTVSPWGG